MTMLVPMPRSPPSPARRLRRWQRSSSTRAMRLVNPQRLASLDPFADQRRARHRLFAPLTASGYANLKQDSYSLDLRQGATTLLTTTTTLSRKKHQTVVAYSNNGTLAASVLDDEEGEPGSGKAKFRVFNTAAADKVDVYLTHRGVQHARHVIGSSDGDRRLRPARRLHAADRVGDAGFTSASRRPGDRSDLRLDIPAVTLSEKRIVTLILVHGSGQACFLFTGLVLDQQGATDAGAQHLGARSRRGERVHGPRRRSRSRRQRRRRRRRPDDFRRLRLTRTVPGGALDPQDQRHGVQSTADTADRAAAGADVTLLVTGATPRA